MSSGISAERERERLSARVEKLDLELAIHDRPWLSDQLMKSLFGEHAVAQLVDVDAVCSAGFSRSSWLDYVRRDLNPWRISPTKSSGCSHAAKCPPLGSVLK